MPRLLALLALLAACGSSEKKAAEPPPAADPAPAADEAKAEVDPEWKDKGDKALGLFRKLHGVIVTNKGDCGAMGDGLTTLADDNEAFVVEARAFQADVKFTRWFDHTYGPELAVLVREFAPVLQTCLGNAKVKAAIMRFEGPKKQ